MPEHRDLIGTSLHLSKQHDLDDTLRHGAPSDNTDLDSCTTAHGLLKKLSGRAAEYLGGDGNFYPIPQSGYWFLSDVASDILNYKALALDIVAVAADVSTEITGSDILIEEWSATAEQTPTFIPKGVMHIHVHLAKTAGTMDVVVYGKFYKRTALGVETLIATSEDTSVLTASNIAYDLSIVIDDLEFAATDRGIIKFYGTQSSSGNNPTATIYYGGVNDSRVEATGTSGGGSTDFNAIHVNAADEISGIDEKGAPIGADLFVIEDSAAANVKKRVQISNLPAAAPAAHNTTHEAGGSDIVSVAHADTTGKTATDHHDNANDPTSDEKAALAGTGTPAVGNPYVNDDDARLTDARTPSAHATTHDAGGADVMAIDGAAGTGSLRTLGTGATAACAGNDARLTDARTPSAHITSHVSGGGDPFTSAQLIEAVAKRLQTSTGPTILTLGAIADGEVLTRSGATIIGGAGGGGGNCYIETGKYTGDGTTGQTVNLTDSSMVIKYLIIWPHTYFTSEQVGERFEKTSLTWGDYAFIHNNVTNSQHKILDNRINSVGTGSFVVDDDGGDQDPNKSGSTYDYMAIGTHA